MASLSVYKTAIFVKCIIQHLPSHRTLYYKHPNMIFRIIIRTDSFLAFLKLSFTLKEELLPVSIKAKHNETAAKSRHTISTKL